MKLYYHHVGVIGAADFRKTVFKDVPISLVEQTLPDTHPLKAEILNTLRAKFPAGYFNCWGVPEGARSVIRNLQEGDYVLLVESARIDGRIPALCNVEAYWNQQFRALSQALWGDERFPYIFFFRTDELNLMWIDFMDHVGFAENFNPRGQFLSVVDSRLDHFDGVEGYVTFLSAHFSITKQPFDTVTVADLKLELGKQEQLPVGDVRGAIEDLLKRFDEVDPSLTEPRPRQRVNLALRPRDAGFVIAVRRVYNYRCVFCGVGLRAPDGKPEVQSAHIYPKRLDGRDDIRNGLCLCRTHHWAFDVGWMAINDDYTTQIRNNVPPDDDYLPVRKYSGVKIRLPEVSSFAPLPKFLQAHRKLAGFE